MDIEKARELFSCVRWGKYAFYCSYVYPSINEIDIRLRDLTEGSVSLTAEPVWRIRLTNEDLKKIKSEAKLFSWIESLVCEHFIENGVE